MSHIENSIHSLLLVTNIFHPDHTFCEPRIDGDRVLILDHVNGYAELAQTARNGQAWVVTADHKRSDAFAFRHGCNLGRIDPFPCRQFYHHRLARRLLPIFAVNSRAAKSVPATK